MEDADEFIKEACKYLDCSFADEIDIEFSTPQIFEFLVRCIWKIDSGSKESIPSCVYPKVITTRLNMGNAISNYLQKFHIRGDTALHTVLYGNINNLRSAFIELIRKLPADAAENTNQDKDHQFFANATVAIKSQPEWVPVYCRGLNSKQEWRLLDNAPETYSLDMFNKPTVQFDPRKWIAQYINSVNGDQSEMLKTSKPKLPPKPKLKKAAEIQITKEEVTDETKESADEIDEEAALQTTYNEKLAEYKALQEERAMVEKKSVELENQLSEYDPELIASLENPSLYAEQLLRKIAELNQQMEEDTLQIEQNKKEAAQRKLEIKNEMRKMGLHDDEMKRIAEMEASLEGFDEKIETNKILAEKLRKRIEKMDQQHSLTLFDYEKQSKDLDEMVRKQEQEMLKMQEERSVLRQQEEKDSEAVNRSFAIIYNILLQHCDHYRGRLAMESFTRIHLYCMEIMEMLRDNGALKQAVDCLQAEIDIEQQKEYDKQFELLTADFQEICDLNEQLVSQIKMTDPNFKLPQL